jgi:hypothetical protein
MALAFVRAERESPHHVLAYAQIAVQLAGGNVSLYEGSISDPNANLMRRVALGATRGYPSGLFGGIPLAVTWQLAAVTVGELADFHHLNDGAWIDLTDGSRLVRDAAAGAERSTSDKAPDVLAVEREVRNGATYPPIIALAENESSPPIIAEGNTRAAAYVRALTPADEVEAIVGYCAGLARWSFY